MKGKRSHAHTLSRTLLINDNLEKLMHWLPLAYVRIFGGYSVELVGRPPAEKHASVLTTPIIIPNRGRVFELFSARLVFHHDNDCAVRTCSLE